MFIATTISIIIKILIIISTSLISLSATAIDRQYSMVLRDSFVDSNAKLSTTGNLAYYLLQSIGSPDSSFPDGISNNYAFQSVQTNLPDTTEPRVVVDGLTNSLNCRPIELSSTAIRLPSRIDNSSSFNLSITSPSCDVALVNLTDVYPYNPDSPQDASTASMLFGRFQQIQCDGIEGDAGKRVLVIFGNLTYHIDYAGPHPSSVGVLGKSAQLLCIPAYTINRVEVTRNGTRTLTVKNQEGAPSRSLNFVTAWDILKAQFVATTSFYLVITSVAEKLSTN